jgi:hypothetical protein
MFDSTLLNFFFGVCCCCSPSLPMDPEFFETLVLLLKFSMMLLLKKPPKFITLGANIWELLQRFATRFIFWVLLFCQLWQVLQMTQADRNSRNQKHHLS